MSDTPQSSKHPGSLTNAGGAADKHCTDGKAGSVTAPCKKQVLIYFAFYYEYDYKSPSLQEHWGQWAAEKVTQLRRQSMQDFAFKRAAQTWLNERKAKNKDSAGTHYEFILESVTNEASFKEKWNKVNTESWKPHHVVVGGALFVHASYEFKTESGIELYGDNQATKGDGTLTKAEIELLPRLHWKGDSKLEIRACNSALSRLTDEAKASKGEDSWIPAQSFANRQGVPTQGLDDTAQFSALPNTYLRLDELPLPTVYLGSYKREWYNFFAGGASLPSREFLPESQSKP